MQGQICESSRVETSGGRSSILGDLLTQWSGQQAWELALCWSNTYWRIECTDACKIPLLVELVPPFPLPVCFILAWLLLHDSAENDEGSFVSLQPQAQLRGVMQPEFDWISWCWRCVQGVHPQSTQGMLCGLAQKKATIQYLQFVLLLI